jgi:hypothetical protein
LFNGKIKAKRPVIHLPGFQSPKDSSPIAILNLNVFPCKIRTRFPPSSRRCRIKLKYGGKKPYAIVRTIFLNTIK